VPHDLAAAVELEGRFPRDHGDAFLGAQNYAETSRLAPEEVPRRYQRDMDCLGRRRSNSNEESPVVFCFYVIFSIQQNTT
jgi:hypothetical protein